MEKEVRYYYSLTEESKIIQFLKTIKNLNYIDKFYEKTIQYDYPMENYSFYSKNIDGRFRLRISKSETTSKAMITWKRRLSKTLETEVNTEEEIEVRIDPSDYENQIYLLENILKLKKIESYERYRTIFSNKEIEIAVDHYPFGIALEIESKSNDDSDGDKIIKKWLDILNLDIKESYKLSWDDKYTELCKEQNIEPNPHLSFKIKVPFVNNLFLN